MSKLSGVATAQLPPELVLSSQIDRTLDSVQQLNVFNASNTGAVSTDNPSNIEVKLNSNLWLNPSSSYFKFNVKWTHGKATGTSIIKNGIASLFRRIRIEIDGRNIETLEDYNVLSNFLMITSTEETTQSSNWSQGWSNPVTVLSGTPASVVPITTVNERLMATGLTTVTKQYTLNLATGFLSYAKLIPLMAFPEITIIFELAPINDSIYSTETASLASLSVENMSYVAELHQLPGSFNQSVMRQVESGGLEFSLPTFDTRTINEVAGNGTAEHEIVSSVKSVKAIYFMQRLATDLVYKQGASFVTDAAGGMNYVKDGLTSFQLRVGSHYYPNTECNVEAQAWEELTKSRQRDLTPMSKRGYSIAKHEYITQKGADLTNGASKIIGKAVYGFDMEKFLSSELISGTSFANQNIILKLTRGDTTESHSGNSTSGTKIYVFIFRDALLRVNGGYQIRYVT